MNAPSTVTRVVVAEPRGFCAGVEMAIKALAWMTRLVDGPVYCYHEIVHNRGVVEAFEAAGVVFVDDLAEVPKGAAIMLSAHGSAPEVVAEAEARGSFVVNAACPLVTKVHHEIKRRAASGYDIIYIGHHGHQEAIGSMAVAPDSVTIVESPADVAAIERDPAKPVALLAQTTLSLDDWSAVRDRVVDDYDDVWLPTRSDLCFATTNRQAAVRLLAAEVDVVVVIGSPTSSNTNALEAVARSAGAGRVVRIDQIDDLPDDLEGVVGITAGASAPEHVVQGVIARLAPTNGVESRRAVDEDEYFPLPAALRREVPADELARDRSTPASQVLVALSETRR
jgi:4-hydroxy-3-methylbut-2-enyl diphosphate reductase